MHKVSTNTYPALVFFLVVVMTSCSFLIPQVSPKENATGVTIYIDNLIPENGYDLSCGINTSVAVFRLILQSDDDSQELSVPYNASVTIDTLSAGTWNVRINAINSDGTVIGYGQADVNIHQNNIEEIEVPINLLDGEGELTIEIGLPLSRIEDPSFESSVYSVADSSTEIEPTIELSGTERILLHGTYSSGSYRLTLYVLDGSVITKEYHAFFLIMAGQVTSGSEAFYILDPEQLVVIGRFGDPYEVWGSNSDDPLRWYNARTDEPSIEFIGEASSGGVFATDKYYRYYYIGCVALPTTTISVPWMSSLSLNPEIDSVITQDGYADGASWAGNAKNLIHIAGPPDGYCSLLGCPPGWGAGAQNGFEGVLLLNRETDFSPNPTAYARLHSSFSEVITSGMYEIYATSHYISEIDGYNIDNGDQPVQLLGSFSDSEEIFLPPETKAIFLFTDGSETVLIDSMSVLIDGIEYFIDFPNLRSSNCNFLGYFGGAPDEYPLAIGFHEMATQWPIQGYIGVSLIDISGDPITTLGQVEGIKTYVMPRASISDIYPAKGHYYGQNSEEAISFFGDDNYIQRMEFFFEDAFSSYKTYQYSNNALIGIEYHLLEYGDTQYFSF